MKDCTIHIVIREEVLKPAAIERRVANAEGVGAVCTFSGIIRPEEEGERIDSMTYEQYEGMAEREIRGLAEEAGRRWPLLAIALEHRVGRVPVGEAAVVVAVGSRHRAEAFEACRFLIDALKQTVPIWKGSAAGPGASEADAEKRRALLRRD